MSAAGYYAKGKRGSLDGAPIWRPKWYGTLGNDAEYREATKPRTEFKAAYYEGGFRMEVQGAPCRLAACVAGMTARSKAKIASSMSAREFHFVACEIEAAKRARHD